MLMIEDLLAPRAVVEVLAYRALVAGTNDWIDLASIAYTSLMDCSRIHVRNQLAGKFFECLFDLSKSWISLNVDITLGQFLEVSDQSIGESLDVPSSELLISFLLLDLFSH